MGGSRYWRQDQTYYADDCLVRAATGITTDNLGVTAQTLQTLHQFPDRELVGEDVIWSGYDDGSFLSSHRLISVMRHTGDGIYGKATGRVVRSRIIADCYCVDTQVKEEWLARDQAAFARCMGIDTSQLALDIVRRELAAQAKSHTSSPSATSPAATGRSARRTPMSPPIARAGNRSGA